MKSVFKTILVVSMLCICVFCLVSCDNGIKRDEAKATINEFFAAVVAEDYDKAESLLHPERPAGAEAFFSKVENAENIDFQAGIEVEKYTGFSSALYDSTVNGPTYELTMRTKVGDRKVIFTIEIVKNENGYGIYNINLDT